MNTISRASVFLFCLCIGLAVAQGQGRGRGAANGSVGLNNQSLGNAHFEIDQDSKTLVVVTDDATNEAIKKLLEQIDSPVPHASIKVMFLEVTHTDGTDVGIDATYNDVEADGTSSLISSLYGVTTGITRGGTYGIVEKNLNVTLKLLAEKTKMEVLSRPSIMARSNQEATITIGDEVPFVRNSQITDDGRTINTVEYEDVGIILKVTPVITDEGTVEMSLESEISTLTDNTVEISDGVSAPTISKRSAITKVVVPDGKTVVIGGLMGTKESEIVRKIPILGSIPLLGRLFQRRTTEKVKTELLIFLTPTVVNTGDAEKHNASEEKPGTLIKEKFPNKSYQEYLNPQQAPEPEKANGK